MLAEGYIHTVDDKIYGLSESIELTHMEKIQSSTAGFKEVNIFWKVMRKLLAGSNTL